MLQMTYDWLNLTHEFLWTLHVHPTLSPVSFHFLSGLGTLIWSLVFAKQSASVRFSLLRIGKAIFGFPLLKVRDGAKITFPYYPVFTTTSCWGTYHTDHTLKGGVKTLQPTDWLVWTTRVISPTALWSRSSLPAFFSTLLSCCLPPFLR